MDLKSNHTSPVLTDPVPASNSILGLTTNLAPYSPSGFPPSLHIITTPRRKVMPSKLDEARGSGWLDIMISSSPPRKKLNKDFATESALEEADAAYNAWLMSYPPALISFNQIAEIANCKKIALFLDYDGTLSPIVDNPDFAFMSSVMRAAVKGAAECFPTAIISGRSRDKVYEFVKLTEIHYAGSHGMDIMGPVRNTESVGDHPDCIRTTDQLGKEVHLFQPASEFLPLIEEVFSSLIEITKHIVGVTVENNKFCVSVHYRNVDQEHWDEVGHIVHDFVKDYPRLKVTYGRKVFEVRPIIDWNKGKAVEFLLESLGLDNSDDVLPIYVGDDRTDEDAFKVLKEGNKGFGILVTTVPKETHASYSLKDPNEVMEFLKLLVKWKKCENNEMTGLQH